MMGRVSVRNEVTFVFSSALPALRFLQSQFRIAVERSQCLPQPSPAWRVNRAEKDNGDGRGVEESTFPYSG
jgi:hypothetical protein